MGVDQKQVAAVLLFGEELDELLGVHLPADGLALLLLLAVGDLGHLALVIQLLQDIAQGLVGLDGSLVLLGQPLGGLLVGELQVLSGVHLDQRLDAVVHGVLTQIAHVAQPRQSRLPQLHLVEDSVELLQADALPAQGHALVVLGEADHIVLGLLALLEDFLHDLGLGDGAQAELGEQRRQVLDHDLVAGGILIIVNEDQDGGAALVLAVGSDDVDQLSHAQAHSRIGSAETGAMQRLDGGLDDLLQLLVAALDGIDGVLVRQETELLVGHLDVVVADALQALGQGEGCRVAILLEDSRSVGFFQNEYHDCSSFCNMWVLMRCRRDHYVVIIYFHTAITL